MNNPYSHDECKGDHCHLCDLERGWREGSQGKELVTARAASAIAILMLIASGDCLMPEAAARNCLEEMNRFR
jgi:hypothetical protein